MVRLVWKHDTSNAPHEAMSSAAFKLYLSAVSTFTAGTIILYGAYTTVITADFSYHYHALY